MIQPQNSALSTNAIESPTVSQVQCEVESSYYNRLIIEKF